MAAASTTILTPEKAAATYLPKAAASGFRPAVVDRGETFAAVAQLGTRDAICTLLGDSTGNENIEWFRLMVNAYAALHPNARVMYSLWDDASKTYGAAAEVQAGATTSGTTRTMDDTFTRTSADLWGTAADTGQTWAGDTNSKGDWSVDGTKAVRTSDATGSVVVIDNGTIGDQRLFVESVTVDTTAAASTKTLQFQVKRAGPSDYIYVQISVTTTGLVSATLNKRIAGTVTTLQTVSTPIPAGATTTFDVVLNVQGTAVTAAVNQQTMSGTLTDTDVSALASATLIGVSASLALAGTSMGRLYVDTTGTGIAAQTLSFFNGSLSGSSLDYQVTNINAILPAATDLVLLSSVHNYGSIVGTAYVDKLDAAVQVFRTRAPKAGIVAGSQNPQKAPATGATAHLARNVALRAAALARGWGYMPVLEAFLGRGDKGASYVKSVDGVHPTTSADAANPNNGSALWSRVALDYLMKLEQPVIT